MIVHYQSRHTTPGVPCRHCGGIGRVNQQSVIKYKWRIDCDRCGRAGPRNGLLGSDDAARDDAIERARDVPAGWRRDKSEDGITPESHICDECLERDRLARELPPLPTAHGPEPEV